MKKKLTVFLIMAIFLLCGNTQAQISGKWKVAAMEDNGEIFDFSNPERFAESIYKNDLKEDPGKVFTKEDSSAVAFSAAILYILFKEMRMEFKKNGGFALTMSGDIGGKRKTEKSGGKYKVMGNAISIKEDKKKETESLEFMMPDKNKLVLSNFRKASEMNLVLERIYP